MSLEAFGVGRGEGGREGGDEGSNTAAVRPSSAQLSTKGERERERERSEREGRKGSTASSPLALRYRVTRVVFVSHDMSLDSTKIQ